ncbi:hypothetical protein V2J09_004970 [Rumex salicifolius]
MAQESERRNHAEEDTAEYGPIKYGDVFPVAGELAEKVIVPKDAAVMRSAENESLGQTIKAGAADVMQLAAKVNVQEGMVDPGDANLDTGIRVIKSDIDAARSQPEEETEGGGREGNSETITIGDALEAAAVSAGQKEVTQSDAAAIHVAEQLASGSKGRALGGVSDRAQAAANRNAVKIWDEDKTKLADVISNAKELLAEDKVVTKKDAEMVVAAEMRTNARIYVTPGAVGESLAAAADCLFI